MNKFQYDLITGDEKGGHEIWGSKTAAVQPGLLAQEINSQHTKEILAKVQDVMAAANVEASKITLDTSFEPKTFAESQPNIDWQEYKDENGHVVTYATITIHYPLYLVMVTAYDFHNGKTSQHCFCRIINHKNANYREFLNNAEAKMKAHYPNAIMSFLVPTDEQSEMLIDKLFGKKLTWQK
jgi:hypothetical protein